MNHETMMNAVMGFLIVAALVELVFALATRRAVHGWRDTLSSITLGIGQQAVNVYLAAAFLGVYVAVYDRFRIGQADPHTWWHRVVLCLACDLCYYTAHRTSHRVNVFVAAHIVHHQAEDYNFLSSFRQGWFAWPTIFIFYLPLAVAGVPLEMFVVGQMGIMLLQFLSHNGVFRGRLGLLDRLLVTPANHRVHHGVNQPYLGANCGGMFVIWDRVFGTFVEEDPAIPIQMGGGFRVNFYDPFEANFDYYRRIVFVMAHRRGLRRKLAIWFESPRELIRDLRAYGYDEKVRPEAIERSPMAFREKATSLAVVVLTVVALAAHRLGYASNGLAERVLTGLAVMGLLWTAGRQLSAGRQLGLSDVRAK